MVHKTEGALGLLVTWHKEQKSASLQSHRSLACEIGQQQTPNHMLLSHTTLYTS